MRCLARLVGGDGPDLLNQRRAGHFDDDAREHGCRRIAHDAGNRSLVHKLREARGALGRHTVVSRCWDLLTSLGSMGGRLWWAHHSARAPFCIYIVNRISDAQIRACKLQTAT